MGLLILAVARAYGVKKVVMFDIESSRTEFAEKYGATVGIVPPRNTDASKDSLTFAQEYAKEINSKYDLGNGFDITVEASGAEVCVQMAIAMLKGGGTMIQAGLGKPLTAVPLFLVTAKELNIKGEFDIAFHACSILIRVKALSDLLLAVSQMRLVCWTGSWSI